MSRTACRKYFQGITASHLRYSHHVFLRNDAGNGHLNIRQTALPRRFAATAHRAYNPRNGSGDGATVDQAEDPAGEVDWMDVILKQAEEAGVKLE